MISIQPPKEFRNGKHIHNVAHALEAVTVVEISLSNKNLAQTMVTRVFQRVLHLKVDCRSNAKDLCLLLPFSLHRVVFWLAG
jgi:hypothetical protein